MTKDTSKTSQKGQSSQYTKSGPTKPRESINRRRTRYKPEYQKFILLVMEEAQAQAHMQAHQRVDLGQP